MNGTNVAIPQTWREAIEHATAQLESSRIDDAELNAEELAAHVLGVSGRSALRAKLREAPSQVELQFYGELIARREQHEPLQYILGEWEFFGLPLYCEPSALIPRPETEILVEEALKEIGALRGELGLRGELRTEEQTLRVLDLGTGTGAIALAIASRTPRAEVIGIDVSEAAIALAERNRIRLGLTNARIHSADMLGEELVSEYKGSVDVLVSNPPYIARAEYEELEPELTAHEPRIALTDEAEGYMFYERIAALAPLLLRPGGRLLVELGYSSSPRVEALMREHGLEHLRTVKDLAGILRVYVGKRSDGPVM